MSIKCLKRRVTQSLPQVCPKVQCLRQCWQGGRVTLGLTGVWWRQTPIAGTDASRTYDARCSYRVYEHDLRFHPSHHITTLPGTIPLLPAFERFPAFPAPTPTTTATNPHHHQLQLSQTPRGERSRVCGGPEFRQFKEVFEFLSFTIRGIFRVFKFHNLSDKDGDRVFRAGLRKEKEE